MILAVDIGNSNITVGGIDKNGIVFIEGLATDKAKTSIEYAMRIKAVFEMCNRELKDFDGAVISSVVPQLTPVVKEALSRLLSLDPLIVGPGIKTGVNIMLDDPAQLGSSLLVISAAALAEHKPPLIVIELGTATTFCTVNGKGQYVGGVIFPGVRTALDSLVSSTSLLHHINADTPRSVIGRNTTDGLKSGLVYGNAACIDGVIERIEEELGETCSLIATGKAAKFIIPHCRRNIIIDEELMLKGLGLIYEKNRR